MTIPRRVCSHLMRVEIDKLGGQLEISKKEVAKLLCVTYEEIKHKKNYRRINPWSFQIGSLGIK